MKSFIIICYYVVVMTMNYDPVLTIKVDGPHQKWSVEAPYPDKDGYTTDEERVDDGVLYVNYDEPGTRTSGGINPKKLITEAEVEADPEEIFEILEEGLGPVNQQVIEPVDGLEIYIEADSPYTSNPEELEGMWQSVWAASGPGRASDYSDEELLEMIDEPDEEDMKYAFKWAHDVATQLPYTDERGAISEEPPEDHIIEVEDTSRKRGRNMFVD